MNPSSPQFPISHVKVTNINNIPATDHRARADYSIRKVNKTKNNAFGRTDEQERREDVLHFVEIRDENARDRKAGKGPNVVKIGNKD
jgi:hypothetical protein